jgi:hypothetical protein
MRERHPNLSTGKVRNKKEIVKTILCATCMSISHMPFRDHTRHANYVEKALKKAGLFH